MYFITKNNLFSKIKMIICISIYIVFVLGDVLGNVLRHVLGDVLLGDFSTTPSTPQNRSIFSPIVRSKPSSATHKKEGLSNYTKIHMGRRNGFYLPSLSGLSAHKGRKSNNEICKNRTIYGNLYCP